MKDSPRESAPPGGGDLEAVAADWLTRLEDESSTAADAEAFARWRAADSRHEQAAARLEVTRQLLAQLPFADLAADVDRDLAEEHPRRRPWGFPIWGQAMAACLVLLATLAVGLQFRSNLTRPEIDYLSTQAEPRTVRLLDGSQVHLAAASQLDIAYGPSERRLRLHQGEGSFTVTPDPHRPFIVTAGGLDARAVGTVFTVTHTADLTEVVVAEGQVQVTTPAHAAQTTSHAGDLLRAGDRLRWDPRLAAGAGIVTRAPMVEPVPAGSEAPMLDFVNTPLAEAVAAFNRYNVIQLQIDAALSDRTVAGRFRADAVEAFAELLAAADDIQLDRTTPQRIVLRHHP